MTEPTKDQVFEKLYNACRYTLESLLAGGMDESSTIAKQIYAALLPAERYIGQTDHPTPPDGEDCPECPYCGSGCQGLPFEHEGLYAPIDAYCNITCAKRYMVYMREYYLFKLEQADGPDKAAKYRERLNTIKRLKRELLEKSRAMKAIK